MGEAHGDEQCPDAEERAQILRMRHDREWEGRAPWHLVAQSITEEDGDAAQLVEGAHDERLAGEEHERRYRDDHGRRGRDERSAVNVTPGEKDGDLQELERIEELRDDDDRFAVQ